METSKKSIRGTQTEKALVIAYLTESAAYTRYTFYARQAEKDGYFPVAKVFAETADNELRHSKVFFKHLEGGLVNVAPDVEAGIIGDTAANLATAVREEQMEGVELYTASAKVAEKEGFPEIASHFREIAEVEESHRQRFERLLEQVKNGAVWKRQETVRWKCLVCGYIHEGTEPPVECPACDHPYQHYMAMNED